MVQTPIQTDKWIKSYHKKPFVKCLQMDLIEQFLGHNFSNYRSNEKLCTFLELADINIFFSLYSVTFSFEAVLLCKIQFQDGNIFGQLTRFLLPTFYPFSYLNWGFTFFLRKILSILDIVLKMFKEHNFFIFLKVEAIKISKFAKVYDIKQKIASK